MKTWFVKFSYISLGDIPSDNNKYLKGKTIKMPSWNEGDVIKQCMVGMDENLFKFNDFEYVSLIDISNESSNGNYHLSQNNSGGNGNNIIPFPFNSRGGNSGGNFKKDFKKPHFPQ